MVHLSSFNDGERLSHLQGKSFRCLSIFFKLNLANDLSKYDFLQPFMMLINLID